ncbi:hypothetical protein RJZ56_004916 [Blastomyces dermatitidis]
MHSTNTLAGILLCLTVSTLPMLASALPTPNQSDLEKPNTEAHLALSPLALGKGMNVDRRDDLRGKDRALAKADAALELGVDLGVDLGLGLRARNGPAPADLVILPGGPHAGAADGSEIKHESEHASESGRELESGKQLVKRFRWWYWRSATDEAEPMHGGLKDGAAAAGAAGVHGDVQVLLFFERYITDHGTYMFEH